MATVDGDRLATPEVEDADGAAADDRERSVAAVGGVPCGAADRGGAIPPAGAEVTALVACTQGLQDAIRERGGRCRPAVQGGARSAAPVRRRSDEVTLEQRQRRQALVR